jgi:parallel beta-helix repeat protein
MKIRLPCASGATIVILFTVQFCLFWRPDPAGAQGSLTPPPSALSAGVPAPSMITLQQIEPRTPISVPVLPATYPITISISGSYYLITNLSVTSGDAIDITANDVTLDLNGFTISSSFSSAGGSGAAINLANSSGNADVTIVNGHISGPNSVSGFNTGIASSGNPSNIRVSGVSLAGIGGDGIDLATGSSTVIESCTGHYIYSIGIAAAGVITRCAMDNSEIGIQLEDNGIAIACSGANNDIVGIDVAGNNCTVKDCILSDTASFSGIEVDGSSCLITGNNCSGNTEDGIIVYGAYNRIDGNIVGNNAYGIFEVAANSGNSITRNSAPNNSVNDYSPISGNNDFAPVQTPSTATSPWANF